MSVIYPATSAAASCEIHHQSNGVEHRLTAQVNEKVSQYASYMFEPVNQSVWSVAHQDNETIVYRRELVVDQMVLDPLRASCTISGVSASEVANYFFDKDTRLEWDGTVESVEVLETLAEDTIVFHQLHKRVWPAVQRDTLFCSHVCVLTDAPRSDNMVGDTVMVFNFSIDHDGVPTTNKLVRSTLQVGMVCQTVARRPVTPGEESQLTREDISCNVIYTANVNPGGLVPAAIVRHLAKKEICKFLKSFSERSRECMSSRPLTL